MNEKSFINIILAVVVVILLGAVSYFAFTQKSDKSTGGGPTEKFSGVLDQDTSSWKTYSDVQHGFEIKYPVSWHVEPSGNGISLNSPENFRNFQEFEEMIRSSNVQGTDAGPSANIHILYYDDITKQAGNEGVALGSKTLEEYVGLSQNNFFEPKKISFAGQTAFRGREAGLYDMDAIWIQKDAHLYKIWLVSDVGMTSDLSAQILSTFKFTR